MIQKTRRRVPRGMPLFPDRPRLSQEEIEKRMAADDAFGKRCREIFDRVSPELIEDHYDWAIMIEPDSGDYFIAQDPKVAFQKARDKHPTADILEMRLNETGTCGRI